MGRVLCRGKRRQISLTERIKSVDLDTVERRAHREELLKGEIREEWQRVTGTDRSISTMLERKFLPARTYTR